MGIDGRKIKLLRLEKGLTQKALAALAGVTYRQLRSWEEGERKHGRAEDLLKVAAALGVSPETLLVTSSEGKS